MAWRITKWSAFAGMIGAYLFHSFELFIPSMTVFIVAGLSLPPPEPDGNCDDTPGGIY